MMRGIAGPLRATKTARMPCPTSSHCNPYVHLSTLLSRHDKKLHSELPASTAPYHTVPGVQTKEILLSKTKSALLSRVCHSHCAPLWEHSASPQCGFYPHDSVDCACINSALVSPCCTNRPCANLCTSAQVYLYLPYLPI
ncbi:hypothetical protein IF1G_09177 [Cordyceps javanica]|uniref:Uncharacterized protein n=1 Tax=Cordyceps javanica TaxID=43265 RepID=A0A545URK8_9HYPO|nr:hypothetical protein IF1G_09177 [Cordyceps javanica]